MSHYPETTSGRGAMTSITSRDNPVLKQVRRLAQDNTAYRKQGQFWIEGDHLCRAALARGQQPALAIFSESSSASSHALNALSATKTVVIPDRLFKELSGLESPVKMGFVFDLPPAPSIQPDAMTVILDRVQDAGNVGSILRSAAAFGFRQVLALEGTAALWSPKVLRAGMGAHFGLNLREGLDLADLDALQAPIMATSSHLGDFIHEQTFPSPCAWVLGHEGQGVRAELMARSARTVRIAQPGGEESLNVAAAAAICLHASSINSRIKL
jgi:RNA methyltransferase, TrmH family